MRLSYYITDSPEILYSEEKHMKLPKYYEDPKTLHLGTMPYRAYYIPFETDKSASEILEMPREESKKLLC